MTVPMGWPERGWGYTETKLNGWVIVDAGSLVAAAFWIKSFGSLE